MKSFNLKNPALWGVAAVAVVVALFIIAGVSQYVRSPSPQSVSEGEAVPQQDPFYESPQNVIISSAVKDGVYTFSGSVPAQSTCNIVSNGISTDEVNGAIQVSLALRILRATDKSCDNLKRGALQPFSASFVPPPGKRVTLSGLSVNGQSVAFIVTP